MFCFFSGLFFSGLRAFEDRPEGRGIKEKIHRMKENIFFSGRFLFIGIVFSVFGSGIALFSYFILENIPLSSVGIAFCILGCVLLIFPEYLVPHRVVRGMISGAVTNIEALLEEFSCNLRAVYLPSEKGKVYAFCPLPGNSSYPYPDAEKIKNAPRRIISTIDGYPGLFIYPPGSDVVALSGVVEEKEEREEGSYLEDVKQDGKDFSFENFLPQLENAIDYLLVDFSELASKVLVGFEKNRVFLQAKNIKLDVDAPRFTRVLGSPAVSLAACVIAQVTKMPVKVAEEKGEGKWIRAVFEVGGKVSG